ncbi:MAG: hypothetical protein K2P92_03775 [Bdellovibrionaceae bacterium]|nr:hypothetical protein [Pseudobdellovibrionaceae bacterium]
MKILRIPIDGLAVLFLIVSGAASARAEQTPYIKLPIVLSAWTIKDSVNHRFLVSDLKKELSQHGLDLPTHIKISRPSQQKKLSDIAFEVAHAGIGLPGIDSALDVVSHRRMADYELGGREKVCYMPKPKIKARENAENAFALYTNLNDVVLSEDYWVIGVRYFDETGFDEEDGGGDFDQAKLNEQFGQTQLEPGAVQIIATLSQHGSYAVEEILAPCKK